MQHTNSTRGGTNGGQRGSVMTVVVLTVMMLSGLAMAMQVMAGSAHRVQRSSLEARQALYLAEAGISRSIASLIAGGAPAIGSEEAPLTWGTGSCWVESADLGDGKLSLISVADVGRSRELVEVIVERNPEADTEPLFADFGLFGGEGVWLNSGERVRSYDSRTGGINDPLETDLAEVGSNNDVTLRSGSRIAGEAYAGPTGSVTVAGGAQVSGGSSNMSTPRTLQPIDEIPVIADSGPLLLLDDQSLASGDHHFSSLEIPSHTTLTIRGPAVVVLDSLSLDSGGTLSIDNTDGAVTFYCTGAVSIEGSVENQQSRATDIRFLIATDSDEQPVLLEPTGDMEAVIFAPNADITIDHGDRFMGALAARTLVFESGSRIYQDLAAGKVYMLDEGVTMSPPPDYLTLSWRPISFDEKVSLQQGTHPHDIRGTYDAEVD